MKNGFVKVASVTPKIKVADPGYNAKEICRHIEEAAERGAKVIVFPELSLTGYTCGVFTGAFADAGACGAFRGDVGHGRD